MRRTLSVLAIVAGLGNSYFSGQQVANPYSDAQFGIVDCFGQGDVSTSNLRGVVVDPTGIAVAGAVISLTAQGKASLQTKSDNDGHFAITAPAGNYIFKVAIEPFAGPEIGLSVGKDLVGLVHPTKLYVLLGLPGSFCPWVVTNDRKFKRAIDGNIKTLKEHTRKNAT